MFSPLPKKKSEDHPMGYLRSTFSFQLKYGQLRTSFRAHDIAKICWYECVVLRQYTCFQDAKRGGAPPRSRGGRRLATRDVVVVYINSGLQFLFFQQPFHFRRIQNRPGVKQSLCVRKVTTPENMLSCGSKGSLLFT
jgi:hypothetical protein